MNLNNYFRVILKNVAREEEDLLTAFCFEGGAEGLEETLQFQQNQRDYSVQTIETVTFDCVAYFTTQPGMEWLQELKLRWPTIAVQVDEQQSKDWLSEWKKGFKAFPLVDDVWVVPHWLERPKEAKHVIWMEPGMAFGTGTHETTHVAAKLLAEALRARPGASVLDVGTGTGILAVLARRLGAGAIVGTDIDPEAVRVARENLELNKISDIDVTQAAVPSGQYDIVVANIIDGVLSALQKPLKQAVKINGALVLSGIIDERLSVFREQFDLNGFNLSRQLKQNEWHGWLIKRT